MLEYRIGDRKVSRDRFFKDLADEATAGALAEVQKKMERVTCPKHGKRPTVTMERTREGASFAIEGCCDALVERVQRVGQ